MAPHDEKPAVGQQGVAGAEYVVRRVPAGEGVGRGVPNEGRAILIGPVPCKHIPGREQSRVDRDERPSGRGRPLADIRQRGRSHRHRNSGTGSGVARGITRGGGKGVAPYRAARGIPQGGIGRIDNLGAQGGAVEEELDACDAYVVGRRGGDGNDARHGGIGYRLRNRNARRRVVDGALNAAICMTQ